MESWIEIYTEENLKKLTLRRRVGQLLTLLFALVALGLCVLCCVRTNTGNALRMEVTAAVCFAVGGLVLLLLRQVLILPGKREVAHVEGLRETESEELTARLKLGGRAVRIPKSILAVPLKAQVFGEERPRRLLISASRYAQVKPWVESGEALRLRVASGFITALQPTDPFAEARTQSQPLSEWETLAGYYLPAEEGGEDKAPEKALTDPGTWRLHLRALLYYAPVGVMWILISFLLWSWIFTFVTRTDPATTLTVFADVSDMKEYELNLKLEEDMPEGITAIRTHRFGYAMFDDTELLHADIYIVGETHLREYVNSFVRLPQSVLDALPEDSVFWYLPRLTEDPDTPPIPLGIRVYCKEEDRGVLKDYLFYRDDVGLVQDYYLLLGINSRHTGELDESACELLLKLLQLP